MGEYLHISLCSCFPSLGTGEIPPGDLGEKMGELWELCGQYWGHGGEHGITRESYVNNNGDIGESTGENMRTMGNM